MSDLLVYLRGLGVELQGNGGQLRYSAPRGLLTPDLIDLIRQNKATLLDSLGETGSTEDPVAVTPRQDCVSFAQERLWILDQLLPGNPLYNVVAAVRVGGPLNTLALRSSLEELVSRHEVLRTNFPSERGLPRAVVRPAGAFEPALLDLGGIAAATRDERVRDLILREAQRPFDLAREPLFRALVIRTSDENHVLVLNLHHIVTDGWSMGILVRELAILYPSFRAGRAVPLAPARLQYSAFAAWQRQQLAGERLERQLSYWRERLNGVPVMSFPVDHPRPAVQSFRGQQVPVCIASETVRALLALAQREGATLFMVVLALFKVLLHRYTGLTDLAVGTPVALRNRQDLESLVGLLTNTLVLRSDLSGDPSVRALLGRVRETAVQAYARQEVPFERLVDELHLSRDLSHTPLVQVMLGLQPAAPRALEFSGLRLETLPVDNGTSKFDLTVSLEQSGEHVQGFVEFNTDILTRETVLRIWQHFECLLADAARRPDCGISRLRMTREDERARVLEWGRGVAVEAASPRCIHHLIEETVARAPHAKAVTFVDRSMTYAELNSQADGLAAQLRRMGVGPDVLVGLYVNRSLDLVVGVLGILKAGGAYVALDPQLPRERWRTILEDSSAATVVTTRGLAGELGGWQGSVALADAVTRLDEPAGAVPVGPDHLAYVLYTSGSSGTPKGVAVEHRNVTSFFAAMDRLIDADSPGTWLALTNISFDISVLEMLWTLARGFHVVVHPESAPGPARAGSRDRKARGAEFSLFYFASEDGSDVEKYRLLLESAQFADQHGFAAVWTPERHFHPFGGLYPNPSVTSAALAVRTERIAIRAGSVVLPLHHPVRVAEEWAVVDNLSGGRVGVSFASGWHANDFALAPDRYESRKRILREEVGLVRRLWDGEAATFPGPDGLPVEVRLHPRPVQRELPIWITAAGNPETVRLAGELGANLLTHLLGQSIDQLGRNLALYREAWREAGYGPREGHVTLMLHAFVGEDGTVVRDTVREPFRRYLRSSIDLLAPLAAAAGVSARAGAWSEADVDALLTHAFDRYFENSGLFGTPESCLDMVRRLEEIGVDEIACLVDFGVPTDVVLESLRHLDRLRTLSAARRDDDARIGVTSAMVAHRVSHTQCTPSMAQMLLEEPQVEAALKPLRAFLVGGEVLPSSVAARLRQHVGGVLLNMYGPTETTVWSTAHEITEVASSIPIGRPLANTEIFVLDQSREPCGVGVPGEIVIGGGGVARGYWRRNDLTEQRFGPSPAGAAHGGRVYHTGDLARWLPNGEVEFLGRRDNQIKIRGHRVELEDVEVALRRHPAVRDAAVTSPLLEGQQRELIAYVTPHVHASLSGDAVRQFLREKLPGFMIPKAIIVLDEMPKTPSGKINRGALPEIMQARSDVDSPFEPPDGPTEEAIARIWGDLLRRDRVGAHENFFDLGGDSLLAAQVIARVREALGVDVPLRALFEHPTVSGLAQVAAQSARGADPASAPLSRVPRDGDLVASYSQERLWALDRALPGSLFFHVAYAVRLTGALDVAALSRAFDEIVRRHESLRTTFSERGGQLLQVVRAPSSIPLPLDDLAFGLTQEQEGGLARIAADEGRRPYDLEAGPLMRLRLVRFGTEEHVLLIGMHHIVFDHWSMVVLMGELSTLYTAYRGGQPSPLPDLPLQLADIAHWQRQQLTEEVIQRELAYWSEKLRAASFDLRLPAARPSPETPTYRSGSLAFALPAELSEGLQVVSRQESVTPFMALFSAFWALIHRYTGQQDFVVGTPVSGRIRAEMNGVIGYLVNTVLLRVDAGADPTFRTLLRRTRDVVLEAQAHQDLPFDALVRRFGGCADPRRAPLCQVVFVLEAAPSADAVELPGLSLTPVPIEEAGQLKYDLILALENAGARLHGVLKYNSDLFDHASMAALVDDFKTAVNGLAVDPSRRVSTLSLVGACTLGPPGQASRPTAKREALDVA